jgi:hypothetical protein
MDFTQYLPTPKQRLTRIFDQLSPDNQEKLLTYAIKLTLPKGASGQELIEFFAQYPVSEEEREQMQQIMEEIEADGR